MASAKLLLVPDANRVDRLAQPWRERVGTASRRALLALLLAAFLASAHLARMGTPPWRTLVAGLLVGLVVGWAIWTVRDRRAWQSPRRAIGRVLLPTDRQLGERALRALALAEQAAQDEFAGSRDLARYHLERLLGRASVQAIGRMAARRASRWHWAAAGFLVLGATAVAPDPARVVEGFDVLLASRGRAPLPLSWLDFVRVTAQPPAYLRGEDRDLVRGGLTTEQPTGTLLTVRGIPTRKGRRLVLTDGTTEVPFVSDGSGGVVARWSVQADAVLRVAARFGEVLIEEHDSLPVATRVDEAPRVEVEGAPRTVHLRDVDRLSILYFVTDDHGLREIDLVLRAGNREERRVLARLSGETRIERGGHALTPQDSFLQRVFLPVQVSIEARDNDPVRGPKWGHSQPITIVAPTVGEAEAARFSALQTARDAIVELLAWQSQNQESSDAEREARRRARRAAGAVQSAVEDNYDGIRVPEGLATFLLGQASVLTKRPRPGASSIQKTEDVLLSLDTAIRALAHRDAQRVARRIADIAEEAAAGAKQARETEQRAVGLARLDSALAALLDSGTQLRRLDALGHDLGSVTLSDRGRIERARREDHLQHAERAARHLAARLRRPKPSTAVVRGAGTETGGFGGPSTWGDPSHADDLFDQLATELHQLVQEHASEIGVVERALFDAEQGIDLADVRAAARQRAAAVRKAISGLPLSGGEPGSARAAAGLAREYGESMAQSLEKLNLSEAVQSGRDAVSALREARRKARDRALPSDVLDAIALRDAEEGLAQAVAWAEAVLQHLRHKAESRALRELRRSGLHEQDLAQRATNLGSRGRISETALPQDLVDQLDRAASLMRQAATELDEGQGAAGLRSQREAQRLLEQSSTGRTTDDDRNGRDANGQTDAVDGRGRSRMRTDGNVPGAGNNESADEFRNRVLEGLAGERAGRLAPAVKRYAEGLLQ